MNKIFQGSKLAQRLQSRLQGLDESIKQQLSPMIEAYQKRQSDFDSAKERLSEDQRAKEESALKDMQQQLSIAQQQAQQAFNQQRDALAKQMREQLIPAVEAIAREKGWDIVMTRNGADVIWASETVDGSDAVIARLNAAPMAPDAAGASTAQAPATTAEPSGNPPPKNAEPQKR
jgi:Skp family chaperone for outer membrane proteins